LIPLDKISNIMPSNLYSSHLFFYGEKLTVPLFPLKKTVNFMLICEVFITVIFSHFP